jgi:hypothetical protein
VCLPLSVEYPAAPLAFESPAEGVGHRATTSFNGLAFFAIVSSLASPLL